MVEALRSGVQIADSVRLSLLDAGAAEFDLPAALTYAPRADHHGVRIRFGPAELVENAADRIDLALDLIRTLYEARTDRSTDLQAVLDDCVRAGALYPGPDCALHESHLLIRDGLRPALIQYLIVTFPRCPIQRVHKWVQYGIGAVLNDSSDRLAFDDADLHMGQVRDAVRNPVVVLIEYYSRWSWSDSVADIVVRT